MLCQYALPLYDDFYYHRTLFDVIVGVAPAIVHVVGDQYFG